MRQRALVLSLVVLSISLTRCALTDHYELTSSQGGASGTGETAGTASSSNGGSSANTDAGATQGGDP